YPGEVIAALRTRLELAGYSLVPFSLVGRNSLAVVRRIKEENFSALAFFELNSEPLLVELRQLCLPMISMDYDACQLGISSVIFDNAFGTFAMTRHLIGQGHREIAFIRQLHPEHIGYGTYSDKVEDERMLGYRIAMQESALPVRIVEFLGTSKARR